MECFICEECGHFKKEILIPTSLFDITKVNLNEPNVKNNMKIYKEQNKLIIQDLLTNNLYFYNHEKWFSACRCDTNKIMGTINIEYINGCSHWENGKRCKKKVIKADLKDVGIFNLYICTEHSKKKINKKSDESEKSESKSEMKLN